jgi:Fe-S cluster assembly ATPase SufC
VGGPAAATCWAWCGGEAQMMDTYQAIILADNMAVLVGEDNCIVLRNGEYLTYSIQELQSLNEVPTSVLARVQRVLADIKVDLVRRK